MKGGWAGVKVTPASEVLSNREKIGPDQVCVGRPSRLGCPSSAWAVPLGWAVPVRLGCLTWLGCPSSARVVPLGSVGLSQFDLGCRFRHTYSHTQTSPCGSVAIAVPAVLIHTAEL